jgi:hypothetical protein
MTTTNAGFTDIQLKQLYKIVLGVSFQNDGVATVKSDMGDHIANYGLDTVWSVITNLGRTYTDFAGIDLGNHVLPYISTSYATNNDVYSILLALKTPAKDSVSGLYTTTESSSFAGMDALFLGLAGVTPGTGCAELCDVVTYVKDNSASVETTEKKISWAKVLAYYYFANANKGGQTVGAYIRANLASATSVPDKRTASTYAGVTAAQILAIKKYKSVAYTTQTPLTMDHLIDKAGWDWTIVAQAFRDSFSTIPGTIKQSAGLSVTSLDVNFVGPFRTDTAQGSTSNYTGLYTNAQALNAKTKGYGDNAGYFVIAKALGFILSDVKSKLYDMSTADIQGADGDDAFTGELSGSTLKERLSVFSTVQKQPKFIAIMGKDTALEIYTTLKENTGVGKAFLAVQQVTVVQQQGITAPSTDDLSNYSILQYIKSNSGTNTTANAFGASVLSIAKMIPSTAGTSNEIIQLLAKVHTLNSTNTAVLSRVSTAFSLEADISGDSVIKKLVLSILTNGNATTILQLLISGTTSADDTAAIALLLTLLDGNDFNDVLNLASGSHSNNKSFVTLYLLHIISSTTDVKDKFTKITGFSNSKLALAQAGFSALDNNSSTTYTNRSALVKKFILNNLSGSQSLVDGLHNMSGSTEAIRLAVLYNAMSTTDNDSVSAFKLFMKKYLFSALAEKMGVPKAPTTAGMDTEQQLTADTYASHRWFIAFNSDADIVNFKIHGTHPAVLLAWQRPTTNVSISTGSYSFSVNTKFPVFNALKIKEIFELDNEGFIRALEYAGLNAIA